MIGFGTVVGMDYEPLLRAVILCINQGETEKRTMRAGRYSEVWNALVVADAVWPAGLVVTLASDMPGFVLIEEG